MKSHTSNNTEIIEISLDVEGSGMFSRYTPAMRQMNATFMQQKDYDPETLYIFVLQRASQDGITGDMPRGGQFGYLFTGTIDDVERRAVISREAMTLSR